VHSLRLLLFEGVERTAEALTRLQGTHVVTHLALRLQQQNRQPQIDRPFPKLLGLSCSDAEVHELLVEGASELRSLVVRGSAPLAPLLTRATGLSRLRHFGLWQRSFTPEEVQSIACCPVMDHLTSLELFDVNASHVFPFESILERREAFAYLSHFGLPGHCVAPETIAAFSDWSDVTFVSHDRRERFAFDLWTTGWSEILR
jgi:hypothetical protein